MDDVFSLPHDPSEQTAYYPPRIQLGLLTLGSVLLAGLGYLMTLAALSFLAAVGWVLLVGFSIGSLVMLVRTLRPGPTAVLTREGIVDRTTLAPTGLVRWDDIKVVRKREIGKGRGSERMLELVLKDRDVFYARERTLLRRLGDRYRALLKHPDVSLPGSMISVPIQQVIDDLRRWRPELQVLELPPQMPRMRLRGGNAGRAPKPPRW